MTTKSFTEASQVFDPVLDKIQGLANGEKLPDIAEEAVIISVPVGTELGYSALVPRF